MTKGNINVTFCKLNTEVNMKSDLQKLTSKVKKLELEMEGLGTWINEVECKLDKLQLKYKEGKPDVKLTKPNLTKEQKKEIKESNEPISKLATKFDRSRQQIWKIRNNSK